MPVKPCLHPGCGRLSRGSYCALHEPKAWKLRPSPSSRDRPPLSLVRKVKARDRRCLRCGSTDRLRVHHLVPVSQGGVHDERTLVTLCEPCHRLAHQGLR
jgi:5-methylcytosine-specific restriction enzyme A